MPPVRGGCGVGPERRQMVLRGSELDQLAKLSPDQLRAAREERFLRIGDN